MLGLGSGGSQAFGILMHYSESLSFTSAKPSSSNCSGGSFVESCVDTSHTEHQTPNTRHGTSRSYAKHSALLFSAVKSVMEKLRSPKQPARCYLLGLPPEPRLYIYEHLWHGLRPAGLLMKPDNPSLCHIVQDANAFSAEQWPEHLHIIHSRNPALLRSCKVLHREARPVMYRKIHFDILVPLLPDITLPGAR